MEVDYAPHIRPHGVNGSMRRESILVNAQVSRTLVDHLADHVYFHLQMAGKQKGSLLFIDTHSLNTL